MLPRLLLIDPLESPLTFHAPVLLSISRVEPVYWSESARVCESSKTEVSY